MRKRGYKIFSLAPTGIHTWGGLQNLWALRRVVQAYQVDLIVTYHESSDLYGLVMAKLCGIPVISNRRDMGYNAKLVHNLSYRVLGRFYDFVVTVSKAVKQEVVDKGWFSAQRIVPIHNGVELEEFDLRIKANRQTLEFSKIQLGLPPSHSIVGMVTNLRSVKGISFFVEAAASISRIREDVEFLVIGLDIEAPGCTQREYLQMAQRLGVAEHIHFLGKRDDIPELIRIFDVAVVASLTEGFSNSILEYMACAKPVVATNVGGNPEAVVHSETGLLVPPAQTEPLAAAILDLLNDPLRAKKYGIAGRKRVDEHFRLERMIENYEKLFFSVIGHQGLRDSLKEQEPLEGPNA
jgi:L-malate glycosyltransferase